jgi:hypothetical protein
MTSKQKRMKKIVKYLQKFMATYDKQFGYLDYNDETLIDDILYGLGVALDEKEFEFAPGFKKFKDVLAKHLENKNVWENDNIQFPRFLAELEAVGAFTPEVYKSLEDSMDLTPDEISELINRAQVGWEHIKQQVCPIVR